jgi:hypothetical protein
MMDKREKKKKVLEKDKREWRKNDAIVILE